MRSANLGWLVAWSIVSRAEAKPVSPEPGPLAPENRKSLKKSEQPQSPEVPDPDPEWTKLAGDLALGKADRVDGTEARNMVTFTFDDGPNAATTPAVIQALERYRVPATFFVVSQRLIGKRGQANRELVKRLVDSGFAVQSHSFSHPSLAGANHKLLTKQVDEAVRILADVAGQPIGMFRAPFGAIDKHGRSWLRRRGLTETFWSVDTLDWQLRDPQKLREKTVAMILRQNGGVVLMHDIQPVTAQIIADVLDDLEAENCRRLAAKTQPILPVSIHYFLRDNKQPRAIPKHVQETTDRYRAELPVRCGQRKPLERVEQSKSPARSR